MPYQLELLVLLLERGADPTAKELKYGLTPARQQPPPSAEAMAVLARAGTLRAAWLAEEEQLAEDEAQVIIASSRLVGC